MLTPSLLASLIMVRGIPTVPSGLQPIVSVLVLVAAVCLGIFAQLTWRHLRPRVCRKLLLLSVALVGVNGLRLLELRLGWADWPLLTAVHSVLELLLLGMLLIGMRRLQMQRLLPGSSLALLYATSLLAVFAGLVTSRGVESLLAGNWAAVAAHLLCYLLASAYLARILIAGLRRRWLEADLQATELARANTRLQQEVTESGRVAAEQVRCYSEQKEEVGGLRQRARTLEKILAISARINATREMSELLQQVVYAVQENLGFRMILLRLYSPSTQAFEARAFAGIPEEGIAHLTSVQVSLAEYRKMTQPRFRISNSFFLSHDDAEAAAATEGAYVPDLGPRAEDEWHEDDCLIIPLISPAGEIKGYLSVDDPADRRVPALPVIRQLEFLARQAATAIDSAEVYERLAQQNRELGQATEMLNSLAEMKSNFVANVSHELRTPLTSITAYAELLQQGATEMTEDVRSEFLKVIYKESDKLTSIVDDILELSRMEGGRARVDRHETDLTSVVRRLGETSRKRAQEKNITFEISVPAKPILINVDNVLIPQMLDHLLSNALKFTPAGGAVRLAVTDCDHSVKLEVEDTGIGIPEEKMHYIFDRFYQADGSSTREHGGQGVGLAICHDIVRYHEGRIWAENVAPHGARFTVVLPRRRSVVQKLAGRHGDPVYGDPNEFLDRLLHWIGETLGVEIVSLMVPDLHGEHLEILAALGLPESIIQTTRVRRGAGIVGKVWASGRTLHIADITTDNRLGKRANDSRYTTPSLLSVPLLDGMEVAAVINVNNRRDGQPLDDGDRLLLESLAPCIGHLLSRYQAHSGSVRHFSAMQEALHATVSVLRDRQDALGKLCHRICMDTARHLKLPAAELEQLAFALQYYDVGLARISDQLLRKRAPLTDEERSMIQTHVAASLDILDPLQVSPKVRQIVLHHHERFDGRGYPDGLEGEAIPIGARLLALTDSLNAMLHDRPYRPRLSVDKALAEIESQAGLQFCQRLTEVFLSDARACYAELAEAQATVALAGQPVAEPVGPRAE